MASPSTIYYSWHVSGELAHNMKMLAVFVSSHVRLANDQAPSHKQLIFIVSRVSHPFLMSGGEWALTETPPSYESHCFVVTLANGEVACPTVCGLPAPPLPFFGTVALGCSTMTCLSTSPSIMSSVVCFPWSCFSTCSCFFLKLFGSICPGSSMPQSSSNFLTSNSSKSPARLRS